VDLENINMQKEAVDFELAEDQKIRFYIIDLNNEIHRLKEKIVQMEASKYVPRKARLWSVNKILARKSKYLLGGVYFLIKEDEKLGDEVVYIGKSGNIGLRISKHISKKDRDFTCFSIHEVADPDARTALEYKYIQAYKPKYNIANNW